MNFINPLALLWLLLLAPIIIFFYLLKLKRGFSEIGVVHALNGRSA